MTEAEWLVCSFPHLIMEHLGFADPMGLPATEERKLRLLACAACRRIWHLLDDQCREAVRVAERHADGVARPEELRSVRQLLDQRIRASDFAHAEGGGVRAAFHACKSPPDGLWSLRCAANLVGYAPGSTSYQAEWAAQGHLIRDLYGNAPKRRASFPLSWQLWNGGMIRKIARSIYDERAFDRLPILGDALEEAGCDNADILSHCRSMTEHYRGCWVVDAILGNS